jgi:apolipoprotein D and lipocalin family protein
VVRSNLRPTNAASDSLHLGFCAIDSYFFAKRTPLTSCARYPIFEGTMQRPTAGDIAALSIGGAAGLLLSAALRRRSRPRLFPISHVDLSRYLGRWYEIARYPNRFQHQHDRDVRVEYSLRPDGKITVLNSCITPRGRAIDSQATATIADTESNAKLKVNLVWPLSGNHWIIDLDPNYEYAVVGEPSRRFLWILSRTPSLPPPTYQEIIARLPLKGYVPSRLIKTRQSAIHAVPRPEYRSALTRG